MDTSVEQPLPLTPEQQQAVDNFKVSLKPHIDALVTATVPPSTGGTFFGGADDSFIPLETTSKLYTGPVLGGRRTRRRHKNKRHSYSRKSKKGLKNKLKRLFGFKGGEGKAPTFSLPKGPSGGGGTTVKPQH